MDIINQVNGTLNKGFEVVSNNKTASIVLGLLLALYAALAAPNLPSSVTAVFKNSLFRLAVMFLIIFMATKDAAVAIITAIAFLVTLQTLSSQETANSVVSAVEKKVQANIEKFASLNDNDEEIENNDEQNEYNDEQNENFENNEYQNENFDEQENFASVPAKSSDNYDQDIEDYSLQNSDGLLYSGGGLHSLPDNVTRDDQENTTFNVSSPAFLDDSRALEADRNIYDQQINGDTYNQIGMEMDSNLNDNYNQKKVQQVPFAVELSGRHLAANSELMHENADVHPNAVHHTQAVAQHSKTASNLVSSENKVVKMKKGSKKLSKKHAVEGFSGTSHFQLDLEDEEEEETSCSVKHNHIEGFQNPEDFAGTCGADPGEAVPGFDVREFASF